MSTHEGTAATPPAPRHDDYAPDYPAAGPGYERRDTNVRAILVFMVGLFAFLIVCQLVLMGLLRGIRKGEHDTFAPAAAAPEEITRQLAGLRAYEGDVLAGKAPASKDRAGAARIPIDRAIDLLSERGIPPTPGPLKTEAEVNSHSGAPAGESRPNGHDTKGGDK